MSEYDLNALTWIHTWVVAALTEKDDMDRRIAILQRCLGQWQENRKLEATK